MELNGLIHSSFWSYLCILSRSYNNTQIRTIKHTRQTERANYQPTSIKSVDPPTAELLSASPTHWTTFGTNWEHLLLEIDFVKFIKLILPAIFSRSRSQSSLEKILIFSRWNWEIVARLLIRWLTRQRKHSSSSFGYLSPRNCDKFHIHAIDLKSPIKLSCKRTS
jgi:hypothetical protein